MPKQLNQDTQLQPSQTFDDTLAAGSTLESGSLSTQDDLNALRSQILRILLADTPGDWHKDIGTVQTLGAAKKYALQQLLEEVDSLEEHRLLFRAAIHSDVAVPAAQNWVELSVASSKAPTEVAATDSTTVGAVVAVATTFGAHNLDEVAGPDALSPLNLCLIFDGNTGSVITSGDRQVFGLLQSEVGTDGHTFNDSTQQVQLSFVRWNSAGTDLEAVPVADIENASLHYAYVRRSDFDNTPQEAFALVPPSGGAGGGAVDSVFGRVGIVVAVAGDYTASEITYVNTTSGMTATDVQAAIDEVEGRVDTLEGTPHLDPNAIHDNVAAEISAIAAKATPTAADHLLIEDAAAANAKKRITIGDIDHDALTNFVPAEHVDWAGAGAGTIHTDNYIEGGAGTDTDAIHDNVAGEINAIANKAAPVAADLLVIEDSAAANAKKNIQIGAIDHDALTNFVPAEHVDWAGAGAGTIHPDNYIEGGPGTDTTAIHDNVAAEISAIAAKAVPTAADHLLIEDAAAANAKKRITIGDIDHDALTNFVPAEHVDWAAPGAGTVHTDNYIEGGDGTDGTAIHDNVAAEISAIAAKAVPTAADHLLIEDAAAANVKKRITIGDIDHDALTNFVPAEHVDWAGAGAGTIHTDNYIEGGAGTDTTAIHDNIAGEIAAITAKATPIAADLLVLEDSAAANAKKKATVGSLPFAPGTGAVGTLNSLAIWQASALGESSYMRKLSQGVGSEWLTRGSQSYPFVSDSTTGGTHTIDWRNGMAQGLNVGHTPLTISFTNPGLGTNNNEALLFLTLANTAGGAKAITWPTTTGTPVALGTGLGDVQLYVFHYEDTTNVYTLVHGAAAGGTGDVVGPGSSADTAVARYDGVTGKLLQDSTLYLSDNDQLTSLQELVFEEPYETVVSTSPTSIDWTNGTLQRIFLTQDVTLTFVAPSAPPAGSLFRGAILTLRIHQNGGGGWAITWPSSVKGATPVVNPGTGVDNATVVQFMFDGNTGFPEYYFMSKGAVTTAGWSPYGLSYDMRELQNARFLWRADDLLTAIETEFGPIDESVYPIPDATVVDILADASPGHHDMVRVSTKLAATAGALKWDTTYGGPLFSTSAGAEAENTAAMWPSSQTSGNGDAGDFDYLHNAGVFTIVMRAVFNTNPAANVQVLLSNTDTSSAASGYPQGVSDGTTAIAGSFSNSDTYFGEVFPNSVTIYYSTVASGAQTATDDGTGGFTVAGTVASGTINYTTGAWAITLTEVSVTSGAMTADFTYCRGILFATNGIGNVVFGNYAGSATALSGVSTTIASTTGVEVDIAVTCDGSTLSMFLGGQATADNTDTWVAGSAGPSMDQMLIGAKAEGLQDGSRAICSDFVLRGLVILGQDTTQAQREQWLNWIGGADFSGAAVGAGSAGGSVVLKGWRSTPTVGPYDFVWNATNDQRVRSDMQGIGDDTGDMMTVKTGWRQTTTVGPYDFVWNATTDNRIRSEFSGAGDDTTDMIDMTSGFTII
jgi:hypothetical protein